MIPISCLRESLPWRAPHGSRKFGILFIIVFHQNFVKAEFGKIRGLSSWNVCCCNWMRKNVFVVVVSCILIYIIYCNIQKPKKKMRWEELNALTEIFRLLDFDTRIKTLSHSLKWRNNNKGNRLVCVSNIFFFHFVFHNWFFLHADFQNQRCSRTNDNEIKKYFNRIFMLRMWMLYFAFEKKECQNQNASSIFFFARQAIKNHN